MTHFLPLSLASVASLADRKDSTRFALANVSVRFNRDGAFTVDATDSKALIRVTGSVPHTDDYPRDSIPGLASAPNGSTAALIPFKDWGKVFSSARKILPAKVTGKRPILGNVAVCLSENVSTFGATDGAGNVCETVANGEGRFPRVDDIMKGEKTARPLFSADGAKLAELLKVLTDFTDPDSDIPRVTFSLSLGKGNKPDGNKPVFIRAENGRGISARGLIMPLARDKSEPAELTADDDASDASAELEAARAELATIRAERDAARKREDEYARILDTVTRERNELRDQVAELRDDVSAYASRVEMLRTERDELANRAAGSPDVPPVPPAGSVPPAELAELESALLQTRAELNARTADLERTRAQLETVSRNLVTVEHNTRDIVADRDRLQTENARLVGRLTAGPVPPVPPVPPAAVPSSAGSPGARPLTRAERIAILKGVGA